jgi:cysteine desulfurase
MKRVYLDYAATTPVDPQVVEAMLPYYTEMYGNPSSVHSCGQEVREGVEEARRKVASLLGAHHDEIVFTSGGTEANNLALKGVAAALKHKGNHIISNALEHHSVAETCKYLGESGLKVTYLPVDKYGRVDPDDVRKAITSQTILISIMHANNEVGTLQPITEIARIAKQAGVYMHTDAVQTAGHIPIDVREIVVDLLSMSAHKLYGPKGMGALYIRKGTSIVPLLHGGGQEQGLRSSTENVPGIIGLGKAVELAMKEMPGEMLRQSRMRDALIANLQKEMRDTYLNGHPEERLPNNVNISIYGIEGESILLNLDLEGICVSTGSACSSTSLEPSHVLLSMGVPPDYARCSLRITLGRWTTQGEIDRLLQVLPPVVARLRAMSPLYK